MISSSFNPDLIDRAKSKCPLNSTPSIHYKSYMLNYLMTTPMGSYSFPKKLELSSKIFTILSCKLVALKSFKRKIFVEETIELSKSSKVI